jgi:hypothetical protein
LFFVLVWANGRSLFDGMNGANSEQPFAPTANGQAIQQRTARPSNSERPFAQTKTKNKDKEQRQRTKKIARVQRQPKRRADPIRDAMFNAIREVTDSDTSIPSKASHVGKACSELLGAEKPYTPDEVRKWAADLQRQKWWQGGPPSVQYLIREIHRVRQAHPATKPQGVSNERTSYRYPDEERN